MSWVATIRCDRRGCDTVEHFDPSKADSLLEAARAAGWLLSTAETSDLCPRHAGRPTLAAVPPPRPRHLVAVPPLPADPT